jgi:hypothetical protein
LYMSPFLIERDRPSLSIGAMYLRYVSLLLQRALVFVKQRESFVTRYPGHPGFALNAGAA